LKFAFQAPLYLDLVCNAPLSMLRAGKRTTRTAISLVYFDRLFMIMKPRALYTENISAIRDTLRDAVSELFIHSRSLDRVQKLNCCI
jgi:hypothetical protein